jgi:predicted nucleic acid-binding protein
METIYIETTVVSYLVANPSRDSMLAAHQQLTRQWWQDERMRYTCVTSEEVLREAALGDAEMIGRRAEALAGMMVLLVDDTARGLAREILAEKILPPAAASDAIHAAVASLNQVNILLTWNCRHLANPHLLRRLRELMARRGLTLPEVCTPIELAAE